MDIFLQQLINGLTLGSIYGLIAIGYTMVFGIIGMVNFAHGEMMTIAMFLAVVAFAAFKVDPLVMIVPIAIVLFALGYLLQAGLINPFINRPEHSQFMLLVAVALIMVNVLLLIFGPDAKGVQTSYSLDSFVLGPLVADADPSTLRAGTEVELTLGTLYEDDDHEYVIWQWKPVA